MVFWARWKTFGQRLAELQARVALTIGYFLVIPPQSSAVMPFIDTLF